MTIKHPTFIAPKLLTADQMAAKLARLAPQWPVVPRSALPSLPRWGSVAPTRRSSARPTAGSGSGQPDWPTPCTGGLTADAPGSLTGRCPAGRAQARSSG